MKIPEQLKKIFKKVNNEKAEIYLYGETVFNFLNGYPITSYELITNADRSNFNEEELKAYVFHFITVKPLVDYFKDDIPALSILYHPDYGYKDSILGFLDIKKKRLRVNGDILSFSKKTFSPLKIIYISFANEFTIDEPLHKLLLNVEVKWDKANYIELERILSLPAPSVIFKRYPNIFSFISKNLEELTLIDAMNFKRLYRFTSLGYVMKANRDMFWHLLSFSTFTEDEKNKIEKCILLADEAYQLEDRFLLDRYDSGDFTLLVGLLRAIALKKGLLSKIEELDKLEDRLNYLYLKKYFKNKID